MKSLTASDRRRPSVASEAVLHRYDVRLASELRPRLIVGGNLTFWVLLLTAASLAAQHPMRWLELTALWGGEAVALKLLVEIVRRAPRRRIRRLALVFALLPIPTPILTIMLVPATIDVISPAFLIVPVGSTLLLGWGGQSNRLWLVTFASVTGGVALGTGFGFMEVADRIALTINILIACLVGWVGGELLDRARVRTIEQELELRRLNRSVRELAATDALTGLANRRHLEADLQGLRAHARDADDAAAVVMLDLDRFKVLNDRRGHQAGDETLRQVARTLLNLVRRPDALYRYGGEEFLLILPGTAVADARALADRLRRAVEALTIPIGDGAHLLTLSGGVASLAASGGDWDAALAAADTALFRAKAAGRNAIAVDPASAQHQGARVPASA